MEENRETETVVQLCSIVVPSIIYYINIIYIACDIILLEQVSHAYPTLRNLHNSPASPYVIQCDLSN